MNEEVFASQRLATRQLSKAHGWPVVGTMPELLWKKLDFWQAAKDAYGDIYTLNLGVTEVIVLGHPRYAQHVLLDNAHNYEEKGGATGFRAAILALTQNGLATTDAENESWRRQRRLAQPFFHRKSLVGLTAAMVDLIEAEIEPWVGMTTSTATNSPKAFDLLPEITRIVMSVFVKTLYGTQVTPDEVDKITQCTRRVIDYMWPGMIATAFPIWVPFPGQKGQRQAIQTIDQIVVRLIERRLQEEKPTHDLLTIFLEAAEAEGTGRMTKEQLRDETVSTLLAGYEPLATAVSWALHLLAQHPSKMQKIQAEIDSVLGTRRPGFADLSALSYTRMVLKEALRLCPPTYWIQRQARQADVLDGFQIPAGSLVVSMVNLIHYHPAVWENPQQFEPERFDPQQTQQRPKLAWMPFGAGKRMCIGEEFAMMQGQLILAQVLQRYSLSAIPSYTPPLQMATNLRPKAGVWVNIRNRE